MVLTEVRGTQTLTHRGKGYSNGTRRGKGYSNAYSQR